MKTLTPVLGMITLSLLLATAVPAALVVTIDEISPDQSTLDPSDPDGASGGRVTGLATVAGDNSVFYAASEWGGLFRSRDGARTWDHLDGHVPTATWDVEVAPGDPRRVYATSFYDGKVATLAGINVSTDAGNTWTHPASATPPAGFCLSAERRDEPSAFGIAVDPNNTRDVYAGTNCGLAISNDRGVNWRYVDPTPADRADNVWDVVVHHGGIIDLCGDDGHQRSTDGGATWSTAASRPLPSGRCSIAVSPDEAHVLFTVVGTSIFESDDGGGSWPVTYANPRAQGRIPFVATNQRSGDTYDLWFGDVRLHRVTCTTPSPPNPGGAQRCQPSAAWAGPFTRSRGAHDDSGDIAFDSEQTVDACPTVFSSDGGVFFNTLTSSPGCHDPRWEQPDRTPHALWNFDFAGVGQAGAGPEDLYFGNQDDGTFGSRDGGAANPDWKNQRCCDGFDVAGDPSRVLSTVCCFGGGGRSTRLFISNPGLTGGGEINNYPPGNLRSFEQLDSIANFGPDDYVVVTRNGVFVTADVGASPVSWTQLGAGNSPPRACGVQVARSGGAQTFYVKNDGCSGEKPGTLHRTNGIAAGGTWARINRPGGGRFGVYAVDPNNPDRILASDLAGANPEMVMTSDGGSTWQTLPALDGLMTGGGAFRYRTRRGPTRFTGFDGYVQPSLVAIDPSDANLMVAGAVDSGVFVTVNGGVSWELVTDPIAPGASGTPHIPRPRYAHFDHDTPGKVRVYLGTQGRGAWRLSFDQGPPTTTTTIGLVNLDPGNTLSRGETLRVRATVLVGGVPAAGKMVSFTSADTRLATVSPASATTNASGVAEATVTGQGRGTAQITAEADGQRASTPVRVPDISFFGLLLLVAVIGWLAMRRRPRFGPSAGLPGGGSPD